MSNDSQDVFARLANGSSIIGNSWDDVEVTSYRRADCDFQEVIRAARILFHPSQSHEIRALPSAQSRIIKPGDWHALEVAAQEIGDGAGTYYTLNPVRFDLTGSAKVDDITQRWNLLIDCDPVKAVPDGMATDDEKSEAFLVMGRVYDWLLDRGWPPAVIIDSGNGAHLDYRVDLPANEHTRVLFGKVLRELARQFDSDGARIDTKVHNASRISKLPGTWARKGPNTADRPWRMSHLLSVPDVMVPVTFEQIEAVAGISDLPSQERHRDTWETVVIQGKDKIDAYVRRAVESECGKVALSIAGERNNILNGAAFSLGQFVGGGFLQRSELEATLSSVALRIGLSPLETEKTIRSGIDAGITQPRVLPASVTNPAERNGKHERPPISSGKFIIWASSIKPRKVDWLCPGRIPLGKMTTFAGQTGLGKTFTVCDLAARVTTGREIPFGGGACYKQGKVLIISAEDDADDTIVPRFMELGGDLSRLALLSPESEEQFSLAALDLLNGCIADMGNDALMVAIDPPTSYLGKVNDHHNAELRGLLAPLRNWARDCNVALVFVTHVNKPAANKLEAIFRVMGGVGWVSAVRSAHVFTPDPGNPSRNLYLPLKVNNAKKRKGLAYEIVSTTGELATLRWLEEVGISADDAMNQVMPKKSAGQSAVEWLVDRFREKSEWRSEDLKDLSREEGLTFNSVFKSPEVNALPIDKKRRTDQNGEVFFVWCARQGWPPKQTSETSERSESKDVTPY
jgi:putative DNA primase/helicase